MFKCLMKVLQVSMKERAYITYDGILPKIMVSAAYLFTYFTG